MGDSLVEFLPLNKSSNRDDADRRASDEGGDPVVDDPDAKQKLPNKTDEVKITFDKTRKIGLTKEQLERYANDPYWIRIRLFFVVAFWLIWIAMFIAAIVIVVLSPKCPEKPPRVWWQKTLCYQIWTPGFADSNDDGVGDLKGIKSRLTELSRIGVQAIRPSAILQNAANGFEDVTSHVKIDSRVGSLQDFDDLVAATHDRDMKVVVDLPLVTSVSHPWFTKYNENAAGYSGFYDFAFRNNETPPELFTTVSENNKSYVPSKTSDKVALLNVEDVGVQKELADAVSFWLDHGVDGFFLTGASLFQELANRSTLFAKLRSVADEKEQSIALFSSIHDTERQFELRQMLLGEQRLDSVSFERLTNVDAKCNARCFYNMITTERKHDGSKKELWTTWQISNFVSGSLAFRMGDRDLAEAMLLAFMMFPGALDLAYGEELGLSGPSVQLMCWNDQKHGGFSQYNGTLEVSMYRECPAQSFEAQFNADISYLKTFLQMAKLRDRAEAFMYGGLQLILSGHGCLAIRRDSITISPSYGAIVNMNAGNCSIMMEEEMGLPRGTEAGVHIMTTKLNSRGQFKIRQSIRVEQLKAFELQAYEAVVLKYDLASPP
uniref:Aamy domain-containing protein n=1 Tax=Trichuris muris TaxID=70415 RepID=A0A5S6Q8H8_TRIMR